MEDFENQDDERIVLEFHPVVREFEEWLFARAEAGDLTVKALYDLVLATIVRIRAYAREEDVHRAIHMILFYVEQIIQLPDGMVDPETGETSKLLRREDYGNLSDEEFVDMVNDINRGLTDDGLSKFLADLDQA